VVRPGFKADLIVVDGNPLHNMKVLYATGLQVEENGKLVQRGGVKYTIKDGVVFEVASLMNDLREMVRKAKETTPASAP
jgi:imidazolonepropionase-like amidohydrolase